MLKKKLKTKTRTKPKRSLKTKSSIRKRPSRKQRRNKKMYEDDSMLNIWNGHGFVMCGLGKKSMFLAKVKHFFKCIKWSKQRAKRGFADYDVWNMYGYLEELMPAMLQHLKDNRMGSPAMLGQNYTDKHGIMQNDACHKEWDKILDRMIFLWRELDEETCSEKNKYEKEYSKASDEFFDKYGFFGEGLETEEEKEKAKKTGSRRVHFMSELPEYEEISRLHMEEEKRLVEYREKCKDEVFDLMKKYFFALWD